MSITRRKMLAISATAIAAAAFGSAPAFAGSSYGPEASRQIGNTTYYGKAFTGTSGTPRGTVLTHASRVVPAGWIGAKAIILGGSTGRVINASTAYSSYDTQYFDVTTIAYDPDPLYHYTYGYVYGWNGNNAYGTITLDQTPNTYQLVPKEYPKTSSGLTYGSLMDSSEAGLEPDLISATGIHQVDGYIRRIDIEKYNPQTPEEAVALMAASRPIAIPVYDIDGVTVVDEFEITIQHA